MYTRNNVVFNDIYFWFELLVENYLAIKILRSVLLCKYIKDINSKKSPYILINYTALHKGGDIEEFLMVHVSFSMSF